MSNTETIISAVTAIAGLIFAANTSNRALKFSIYGLVAVALLFASFSIGGVVHSSQLTEENVGLKQDKSDLSSQVRDLQIRLETQAAQLKTQETQIATLQEQVAAIQDSNTEGTSDELAVLKQQNEELLAQLEEAQTTISNLQEQLKQVSITPSQPTTPVATPANLVQTGTSGITYTIVETSNSNGNITIWLRAVNEGAQVEACLSGGTYLFDEEGIQRKISYFIINNQRDEYGCGQAVIPSGIPIRLGFVFEGLDVDTDLIPQLTSDVLVYSNIPVPYKAEN